MNKIPETGIPFYYGKKVCSVFVYLSLEYWKHLCRNRSETAFFGAWFRLRTFLVNWNWRNIMKKILLVFFLITAFMFILISCNSDEPTQPTISISDDGYLVVDGVKTEYEVNKPDEITVSDDGYVIVNGVKTELLVDKDDIITVNKNGYLVVNGITTEYLVDKEDVIAIVDGYLVVNGIKTEYEVKDNNHSFGEWKLYNEDTTNCEKKLYYRVCSDCETIEWKDGKYNDHSWNTITTKPTCQEGGYDTKTCANCGAVEICNNTPISNHTYSESFLSDGYYHWKECTICHAIDFKGEHIINGDNTNCSTCDTPIKATVGVIYEISTDGTYAMVTGYEGTSSKVKISDEYNGIPVKQICSASFANKSITDVIIPQTVVTIDARAFVRCAKLVSVEIPYGVTNIGALAFDGCHKLTNINIPNSVVSIGDQAFNDCSSLTNIVIPDSVTGNIGQYTFCDCTSLKSVVIGNNVECIGMQAFENCSSLESVVIGNSVSSIVQGAFSGCSSLKNIILPDGVKTIGAYAFRNCKSLSSITMGNNLSLIGAEAFVNCTALKSIVLGSGVKTIAQKAFNGCSSLEKIAMYSSITTIGNEAFSGCFSLSNVYYSGDETAWELIEIGERNYSLTGATRHYNYIYEG